MAAGDSSNTGACIESREELVAYLEAGCKPRGAWRIGTEHEKLPFYINGLSPVPYEGPAGIAALIDELCTRFGWQPVYERENVIALQDPVTAHGGSITLEPGGQFELSGAPFMTLHETCAEVGTHLRQVGEAGKALGIGFLGLGFSPQWTLAETPVMPKERYRIMRDYMPSVGRHGLDMMFRSCTVQVNLDFSDEADMVKKMRVGLALQPVATALFAASPFTEGRPNGFLSLRSELWRDTDNARAGMLPWVFEDGMGFERYVDYALAVPMYCVCRDGQYTDTVGASFRDFMAGRLPQLPGVLPSADDWANHLTTLFPEVRLKRFLEMRGADAGPWPRLCALPALWTGLLYDAAALEAAWALVRGWTAGERQAMRDAVPRSGLKAEAPGGRTVLDLARDVLAIAKGGLEARNCVDLFCGTEARYLEALETIAASGETPAEVMLRRYEEEWGGRIEPVFKSEAY